MPELPEVEVICQGIAPHLIGRKLLKASFSRKKLRLPFPRAKIEKWVSNHQVATVERRAKYLVISLKNQARLIIHLGMTGRLGIFPCHTPVAKHDHVRLLMDNQLELRFNDTRRFGSLQVLTPNENIESLFEHFGPDPFWDSFSAEYLEKKARVRTIPAKNFLMDNRVVTGIGNIYASEILFATGINPGTSCHLIEYSKWQEIVVASRKILEEAILCGGTTISDYVNISGERGYFQVRLKMYGRESQPCTVCGTPITKIVLGGRASFFCAQCQPIQKESH